MTTPPRSATEATPSATKINRMLLSLVVLLLVLIQRGAVAGAVSAVAVALESLEQPLTAQP